MNYKLMARIILEKGNESFGAAVIDQLKLDEVEELISNIEDKGFLAKLKYEIEKGRSAKKAYAPRIQRILEFLERKIGDHEDERDSSGFN